MTRPITLGAGPDQPVVHRPLADRDLLGLRVRAGVDGRRRDVHQHPHVRIDDPASTRTARTSVTASPARRATPHVCDDIRPTQSGQRDRRPERLRRTRPSSCGSATGRTARRSATASRRRHRDHRSARPTAPRPTRLDLRRLHPDERDRRRVVPQLLHRRVPPVHGYDKGAPRVGPYNIHRSHRELGGALPVPGRPADLVLRHLPGRQQRG